MREYLVTVLLAAVITYLITPSVKDLAVEVVKLPDLSKMTDEQIEAYSKEIWAKLAKGKNESK